MDDDDVIDASEQLRSIYDPDSRSWSRMQCFWQSRPTIRYWRVSKHSKPAWSKFPTIISSSCSVSSFYLHHHWSDDTLRKLAGCPTYGLHDTFLSLAASQPQFSPSVPNPQRSPQKTPTRKNDIEGIGWKNVTPCVEYFHFPTYISQDIGQWHHAAVQCGAAGAVHLIDLRVRLPLAPTHTSYSNITYSAKEIKAPPPGVIYITFHWTIKYNSYQPFHHFRHGSSFQWICPLHLASADGYSSLPIKASTRIHFQTLWFHSAQTRYSLAPVQCRHY